MSAAVDVRGWGWRHAGRRRWACRGVDLVLAPGERVLLVGPSGAGKSTLMQGLAGLLDVGSAAEHEGTVHVDGRPAAAARDRIGMLFQDPEAALVMSRAGDDVAFGLENAGTPRSEIWPRVDAAMAAVGFDHPRDRSTAQLSGGEQQRLALAGALVRRPGLLLLDEPTANLDPAGVRTVLSAVQQVTAAHDSTVVLVEHRITDALDLVDRVVVLEPGGGVVEDGDPTSVFTRRGGELRARGVWVPAPWAPPPARRVRADPAPTGTVVPAGPAVAARDLGFGYPDASPVLEHVDLTLERGTVTAVTGANGSGKSTLATLLAGLARPDSGGVHLPASADPDRPLHRWRARDLCRAVGTVFQDPEHQFVTARVDEEMTVGPDRAGQDPVRSRRRCADLLERLGLAALAGAHPFTLSGGEKRRLSVATALATAPELVVLDEPTFGQDARTWEVLVDLLAELRDAGTTVLAVTHDRDLVDALADVERVLR